MKCCSVVQFRIANTETVPTLLSMNIFKRMFLSSKTKVNKYGAEFPINNFVFQRQLFNFPRSYFGYPTRALAPFCSTTCNTGCHIEKHETNGHVLRHSTSAGLVNALLMTDIIVGYVSGSCLLLLPINILYSAAYNINITFVRHR
jgi:hypothetical protein